MPAHFGINDHVKTAEFYLRKLCDFKPDRRTGSAGNRAATDFFARIVKPWGYALDTAPFTCLDHRSGEVWLECEGVSYPVKVSPYSLGCEVKAALVTVFTVEELENCSCTGKILLLRGEICAEQLMPKNFPFYNPDHHQKIYALLEEKRPAAIITATKKNPDLVGALDPPPLFVDGDFDIPSVYCDETSGEAIAARTGKTFRLKSDAERIPSTACNVIARRNLNAREKIVVGAHVDTYENTPGASDNASGVVVLLLLAEKLKNYHGPLGIEIAAFNGEDNYSAAGQKDYLRRFGAELNTAKLVVNVDDVGYREGKTAYSFYECPDKLQKTARAVFGGYPGLLEGPQWFQGDHMIFAMQGKAAIAFTTEMVLKMMATVTHTPKDTPDLIDCSKLVETARALASLIEGF